MNDELNSVERVIGLDSHPDSFTAAALRGTTPANAVVEKLFNKLPMARLQGWAKKNTTSQIRKAQSWSARQWQVIELLLSELRHANQQRERWRSLIAQEVLADPQLLSIVRLCGVREMVAFALGAFVGDIQRFPHQKKLVKYVGLNPAFDDSGENDWSGGIGGHGNKYLRCLLVEAAQAILRCSQTPLAKWGKKLLARTGKINLVVAAMARKLTVAAWYLMMGSVGREGLKALGKTREVFREEISQRLKSGRDYVLVDPNKKFIPGPKTQRPLTLAQEYGLR